jgi:regulator of replication initiation timing
MKKLIYLIFLILFSLLSVQVYKVEKERRALSKEMTNLAKEVESLRIDNDNLADKLQYFSDPHNLEKELRSRFNYRLPTEKLIIIVPPKTEKATSSAE